MQFSPNGISCSSVGPFKEMFPRFFVVFLQFFAYFRVSCFLLFAWVNLVFIFVTSFSIETNIKGTFFCETLKIEQPRKLAITTIFGDISAKFHDGFLNEIHEFPANQC